MGFATVLLPLIFGFGFVLLLPQGGKSYSWYSTVWEWQHLAMQDKRMVRKLEELVHKGKPMVDQLMKKIENYKTLSTHYVNNLHKNSYSRLTKDYALSYNELASFEKSFPINRNASELFKRAMTTFPKLNDMDIVLRNLLDLQKSNHLKTHDIANGYILKTNTQAQLSTNAFFNLASISCSNYTLHQCTEWCEEAKSRINETTSVYKKASITAFAKTRMENERFSNLCERSINETYVENRYNPSLKCFLWDNYRHPWLILRPIRAELFSVSPAVILYYDVINDATIQHIRNTSAPLLGKALTLDRIQEIHVDSARVAHNCWINDFTDKVLRKMNRLVQAITGLHASRSIEMLQVANYGIGGHYYAHIDALEYSPELESKRRNREATFMYYLSDVEYGGATVFVHPGVAVRPVKGAAVFWRNLLWDSGLKDPSTLHGGCPVVLGDKWIANKWIWETSRTVCEENRFM